MLDKEKIRTKVPEGFRRKEHLMSSVGTKTQLSEEEQLAMAASQLANDPDMIRQIKSSIADSETGKRLTIEEVERRLKK